MDPFLSNLHRDLRSVRLTRRGATHDPAHVPTGTHKEYPRMERIPLPKPVLETKLLAALTTRYSASTGNPDAPISLQECGTLLGAALARRSPETFRRNYPSGGALYPVETYLITTALEGAGSGVYHYHPTAHALERLWALPREFVMTDLIKKPDTINNSSLIVFTSVWERSSAKYGDFTYGLALLEAGHMSENVLLVSAGLKLSARPMAGFNDQKAIELLDLDPQVEQPIHSITLGKPSERSAAGDILE